MRHTKNPLEVGAEYLGGGESQKENNVYLALKMKIAIYDVPDFHIC